MLQTLRGIFNETLPLLGLLFYAGSFPNNTGSVFLVALFIIVFRFSALGKPGDFLLFVAGAFLGYVLELLIQMTGLYSYNATAGVPLYMLIVWGMTFLFLDRLMILPFFSEDDRRQRDTATSPPNLVVLIEAVSLVIGVWLLSLSPAFGALFLLLVLAWRIMRDPRLTEIILAVAAAVIGTVIEGLLVSAGLYTFSIKHFLGMPFFLPLIWALMILIFAHVVRKVRDPVYHI